MAVANPAAHPRSIGRVGSLTTRTITSLEELEGVRRYWEAHHNHPDIDLDHFMLVCRIRREVVSPYVAVVERDGRPCAVLAGRLEETGLAPSIGYCRPFRIRARVLSVLCNSMLGHVDDEISQIFIRQLWSVLEQGVADVVDFYHIPEEAPILRALEVHGPKWFRERKRRENVHWEMQIPDQEGFLLRNMKSKNRSAIQKRQREFEAAFPGRASWRWMKLIDDAPALCDRLERVAATTYQRRLEAGFINDEEHRQRFALFAEQGKLRIQLLEIDGEVGAFWIGTTYQDVFHLHETGYNPALRKYHVGTQAFIRMGDELVREGIRKFDFGLGDAHYKQRFGDRCRRETTIRLFAPTVKGITLQSTLGMFTALDDVGRSLVQRVGLLNRLKHGWRRRLVPGTAEEEA